ncbi:hypothetical protein [Lactobacillus sp. LL6]|uniref:hypothetical protein n=1 Tax=Lactobacillus sp. LL6 TaxID=2596827 RepID=UPI001186A956|nr:hypothetical protein [Lactobacillus sp. LL6]TSO25259.1 hypothetical protein FOD82_09750 [Lactobacillus sp. LL6]
MAKISYNELSVDQKKDVISSLVETAKILTILDKDILKNDKAEAWKELEKIQDEFSNPETRTTGESFSKSIEDLITETDYSKYYYKE